MFNVANSSTTIVGGAGTVSSGTTLTDYNHWTNPHNPLGLIGLTNTLTISNTIMNRVQNHFVAVFKIERNDKNEITSAKFIKEMWVETKNGSSVDFEVAKDKDISQYSADEITIKTIYTVSF